MNRRNFLKLAPAVIAVGFIAPKLLITKEPIKLAPMQIYEPRKWENILSTPRGLTWIEKAEIDFHKGWQKQREVAWMQYNWSMMNIQSYIK